MRYCHDSVTYCHTELYNPDSMNTFYPYRLAKLVHYDYSQDQKWYIDFAAYSIQTGKLKRKRIFEFNNIIDLEKRRKYAENLKNEINDMLVKGFHFDSKKVDFLKVEKAKNEGVTFRSYADALQFVTDRRNKDFTERTRKDVKSKMKLFKGWLNDNGILNDSIKTFSAGDARDYIFFLSEKNDFQNITINNHIRVLKALFEFLKENEIVTENHFRAVKRKKEVKTRRNLAYTDKQIKEIREYLLVNDPEVWQFCKFIYYSFMRPVEIRSLTWGNVNFETNYIYLDAEHSKVKIERYVQITKPFLSLLQQIKPKLAGTDDYIFASRKQGKLKAVSNNYFTEKYREALTELGLTTDYTMYSWKHTGNVHAYKKGVGLHAIMRQNGHTQIETTVNYLKSLGLLLDTEFTEKMNDVKI